LIFLFFVQAFHFLGTTHRLGLRPEDEAPAGQLKEWCFPFRLTAKLRIRRGQRENRNAGRV
jgi:hypothetical protein